MSCVIVTGCYRTGSSAIAGVIHHLGVSMGEVFDPPTPTNPKGFYEDVSFKSCHKTFCEEGFELESYKNIIRQRDRKYDLWGVKDPLFCYCLSLFTTNLNELRIGHRLIDCNRSLSDIARSLAIHLGGGSEWEVLAKRYIDAKELELANYNGSVLKVDFSELKQPTDLVRKIADFVDVPMNKAAVEFIERP